jgi:hypothetical protein
MGSDHLRRLMESYGERLALAGFQEKKFRANANAAAGGISVKSLVVQSAA